MRLTTFCTTALFLALNVNGQEEGTSTSTTFSFPSNGITIRSTLRPSFTLPFTSGSLPSLTLTGSETLSISPTLPTSLSTTAVSESEPVTVTTTSVPPLSTTIQTTTESLSTSAPPSSTTAQATTSARETITETATSAGAANTGTGENSASLHSFNGNVMLTMVLGLMVYLSL
ncbi:hypothetical protein Moror_13763 [Moniliophthora roreri MCA 2997]|uniref:Uncharacterized protein n=1 Tax=Moniliophthora roreri (strain MCA 2997) TaxID=1381753 RepID=V2YF69_MONRO|nr:hypothetical protein Moror_13763 [Moniliophthora roreri MCA 2997]